MSAERTESPGLIQRLFPTIGSWTGNFGWPILLKQLRTEFRKNRFFYSHFVCLAVLGGALLLIVSTKANDPEVTPTQIGHQVFSVFFLIQLLVVLVIFPAFSATAFTEERSNLSLDLLLITTLRSEEIVLGKFLASSIYCVLYVLATLPLLSISFLFGGVNIEDALLAYSVLVGLTLLVSMVSLWISSWFRSNIRATFTAYVFVLVSLGVAYVYVYLPWNDATTETVLAAAGTSWSFSGETAWIHWMALGFDVICLFGFLFLWTANRIRPPAEDHSSRLRVLAGVWLPIHLVLAFFARFGGAAVLGSPLTAAEIDDGMRDLIIFAGGFLFFFAVMFSTEEADVSTRCRRQFRRWSGFRYPLRLFAPGAFWGLIYSLVLTVVVCVGLLALYRSVLAADAGQRTTEFVREAFLTLPIYVAGFGALGFLLSVSAFTPLYSRLTVTFIFVITLLLPLIFFVSDAADQIYNVYYLSPIVLWSSLDYLATAPESGDVTYRLYDIHQIDVAKGVFGGMFLVFGAFGLLVALRSSLPLLRFKDRRVGWLEDDASEPSAENSEPDEAAHDEAAAEAQGSQRDDSGAADDSGPDDHSSQGDRSAGANPTDSTDPSVSLPPR